MQVTANSTGEVITFNITSAPSAGDTIDSTQQFNVAPVTQSPPKLCFHPLDPIVYSDEIHSLPWAPTLQVADYWVIYSTLGYSLQSTAVTPYAGKYCLSVPYNAYGTFQFARPLPIFLSEVVAVEMYLQASSNTTDLQISFNGPAANTGTSNGYNPSITTSWTLYRQYLNTSDIPAQITSIYFQFNANSDITIYYDNVQFVLVDPAEGKLSVSFLFFL